MISLHFIDPFINAVMPILGDAMFITLQAMDPSMNRKNLLNVKKTQLEPDVPVMVTLHHASFRYYQEIPLSPGDGEKTIKQFLLDLLGMGRKEDGYLYYTDEPSSINSLLINACLKAREWKYFSERTGFNVKVKKRVRMKRVVSSAIDFTNRGMEFMHDGSIEKIRLPFANVQLLFFDGDPLEIPDDCKENQALVDELKYRDLPF